MAAAISIQELPISNLAQTDAIADLFVDNGLVTRAEILEKVSTQRAIYQRMLNLTRQ
jgi:hypothetical protein